MAGDGCLLGFQFLFYSYIPVGAAPAVAMMGLVCLVVVVVVRQ